MITNLVNGKQYIGQTVNRIEDRFKQHCKKSKLNNSKCKLSNAIKKYGKDNFKIELLEDDISSDKIDMKEIKYIEKYKTCENGYNTSRGGDAKSICEVSQKKIIEEYKKGKPAAELAKIYNVSSTTVLRILYASNIKIRASQNKKEEIKDDFLKMYNEKTIDELSKIFSISPYSIRRWARRFGLETKERKRRT